MSNLWTGVKTGFKNAWTSSKNTVADADSTSEQWLTKIFEKFKNWMKDTVLGPIKKVYVDIKGKYIDPIMKKL